MPEDGQIADRPDGTVAAVTGASSGIGEAMALELASQGAKVAIAARRRDRLDDLAGGISAAGGEALVLETDVTAQDAARHAVQSAGATFLASSTRSWRMRV